MASRGLHDFGRRRFSFTPRCRQRTTGPNCKGRHIHCAVSIWCESRWSNNRSVDPRNGYLADQTGVPDSDTLLSRSRVYDGLGEAIQNVEDHAYPAGAFGSYPMARKWWMTGAVEPSKKRFTIAIYDQGVTIPVSLPRWSHFDDFKSAFARAVGLEYNASGSEHDGQTIAQAVQLGRSSTGKSWHGKDLPVIRDIIENCKDGTVRIVSRNGEYSYSSGKPPLQVSHIVYCSPYFDFAVARNAPPISYVPVSLSLFGNSPNLKPRVGEALCRFCSSLVIAGFHGRAGYLASWRPLYEGHRAIRITGLPFKTFDEAEAACDAMLKHLTSD
jgi:hypothetical protein